MNIDIKRIENLKEELATLEENEVCFVEDKGISKYVIIPMSAYEEYEEISSLINDNSSKPIIRVAGANEIDVTYEEYEKIKQQINDAVDQAFKPKPEKLN